MNTTTTNTTTNTTTTTVNTFNARLFQDKRRATLERLLSTWEGAARIYAVALKIDLSAEGGLNKSTARKVKQALEALRVSLDQVDLRTAIVCIKGAASRSKSEADKRYYSNGVNRLKQRYDKSTRGVNRIKGDLVDVVLEAFDKACSKPTSSARGLSAATSARLDALLKEAQALGRKDAYIDKQAKAVFYTLEFAGQKHVVLFEKA